MIKVTAVNYVKEGCVDEFLAISKELVEKTNALDKGCIRYELCRDVNDPLRFIMMEEWEDQPSLDAHMKASHFTENVPKFGNLTSKPSELTLLDKVF
ncbi:MAG: antibiotic biosynthesis monooxygenase [Oscillospiraceae bacterium]|nr:antibiotic biosynthesis monooxygenase [Oscillospiraceae bacterium]